MSVAISVENVGKRYLLSHQRRQGYVALRDVIAEGARNVAQRLAHPFAPVAERTSIEEFWALNDVSFEVREGERVGIVGRNGAGKSTLLKVLSRITEPTRGRVRIRGRVASLLEVGTGFHPELTGRENIFLNGAMLGMSRAETSAKFDTIVAFAEVEKFLDTPVKRYSSGMYMRLAFAVAAHLEPEILVIDEVLAVGDAQFQKKCLGRMEEVGRQGRTVLFVSHNMQAVRSLCNRGILLESGCKTVDGTSEDAVDAYLRSATGRSSSDRIETQIASLPADPVFKLSSVRLSQDGKEVDDYVLREKPLDMEIRYTVSERTPGLRIYFDLHDDYESLLLRSFHDADQESMPVVMPGEYVSRATIPPDILGPLRYTLRIRAGIYGVRLLLPKDGLAIPFHVELSKPYSAAYPGDPFWGKVCANVNWNTTRTDRG